MQPLWQCGTLGERMSTKVVTSIQRRRKRKSTLEENKHFCQEGGERRISATGVLGTSHVFSVSSMLERIRRRREQRCSLLEKARKLRMERNQVCGEFETMLNSCLEKGIVDTGCVKMVIGSDTFNSILVS